MASLPKDGELYSFDVPEIDRHSSSHTLYKIVLQVTPKELTENSYQLVFWKRYNDIRKLYETLQKYHKVIFRPGEFPDFTPPTKFIERFDPAVADERRIATRNFLNYVLQHNYLRTHEAYTSFFQKGEKVLLPDVQTAILQPEVLSPPVEASSTTKADLLADVSTPSNASSLANDSSNETKKEEPLLTTAEEEQIEHVTNRCAQIIDDLTDLRFEQEEELDKQKEEFNLVKEEIDEVTNLLSLPITSTIAKNNSS